MKFRSKFEKNLASKLKLPFTYECTKLGYIKKSNRRMVCGDCGSNNVKQWATYLTDFKLSNGIYIEAKGWFKPADRTKMVSVIQCNPLIDIRMVFQRDGWCTSKKLMKYSQWCDKNGIKYAIGSIPSSWEVN